MRKRVGIRTETENGQFVLSLPYHLGSTWTRSQAKQVQARVDRLRQAEARGGGGGGQR